MSFCDHVEDWVKDSLTPDLTRFHIFPKNLLGSIWDSIKTGLKLSNAIMVKLIAIEIRCLTFTPCFG